MEFDLKAIDAMGRTAVGSKVSDFKISKVEDVSPEIVEEEEEIIPDPTDNLDGDDGQPTLF
jgi:hypothetical protein